MPENALKPFKELYQDLSEAYCELCNTESERADCAWRRSVCIYRLTTITNHLLDKGWDKKTKI